MGERIASDERNSLVGNGSTQIAPTRPNRVALVISPGATAAVWVSFRGPAQIGVGIRLPPNTVPLVISGADMTGGMGEEINAISEGATQTVGVWEYWT